MREGYPIQRSRHGEYVYIENPFLLTRFAGYLKFREGKEERINQIFMRGQTDDHPGMVPSLFRGAAESQIPKRKGAYEHLLRKLRRNLIGTRFHGVKCGALLQHYGIKTPWIDLVDNLFVALWFATKQRINEERINYQKTQLDYGWIFFMRAEEPLHKGQKKLKGIRIGEKLMITDLRRDHSSLSLRLHAQHGISLAWREESDIHHPTNHDMEEFLVAAIKFPIGNFVTLINGIDNIPTEYMFPSANSDDTYRQLRNLEISKSIKELEDTYELGKEELGKIDIYAV
jgi:hypothetical protein